MAKKPVAPIVEEEIEEEEVEETPPPKKVKAKGPSLQQRVDAAVAKHGDSTAALRVIMADRDALSAKLTEVGARVPADDAVVLSADDAKEFNAYRALGKPADLRKSLDAGAAAIKEAGEFRAAKHVGSVAGLPAYGWNANVLAGLAKGLELRTKEVEDEKKNKVTNAYVVTKDAEGKEVETELGAYAKKEWPDYMPALKPQAAPTNGQHRTTPPVGRGAPLPPPPVNKEANGQAPRNLASLS